MTRRQLQWITKSVKMTVRWLSERRELAVEKAKGGERIGKSDTPMGCRGNQSSDLFPLMRVSARGREGVKRAALGVRSERYQGIGLSSQTIKVVTSLFRRKTADRIAANR
jgi:hypothetical protein